MTIKQLTEAIDTLKSEIAEMQVQMKRAGEDREKENKEFQMTVADQRATKKLLTAALNRRAEVGPRHLPVGARRVPTFPSLLLRNGDGKMGS